MSSLVVGPLRMVGGGLPGSGAGRHAGLGGRPSLGSLERRVWGQGPGPRTLVRDEGGTVGT